MKIKNKIRKFFIAIGIVGVASAAPLVIMNNNIKPHLQIKVPKEKIIHYKKIKDNRKNKTFVAYYYEEQDPPEIDEIIERRTRSSKTYSTNKANTFRIEIRAGLPYEKKGNRWYEMKTGTTTVAAFSKQTKIDLTNAPISRILGKTAQATTVNEQVGASSDDADQDDAASSARLTNTMANIGDNSGSGTFTFGGRFQTVNIAQGSTIDTATVSVKATWPGDSGVNMKIYAEDVDDATTFTSADGPADRLSVKTTAAVDWDPGAFIENAFNTSPSIVAVVQEIVDRAGWVANNSMNILITDDGGGSWNTKEIYTYDNAAADAIKMDITYTASAAPEAGSPPQSVIWFD